MINTNTRKKPDNKISLHNQAYHHIKGLIISRKLLPGQYLNDKDIAEELKMSRTPVRSALSLLEHEGLIQNEHRKGWKVFALSLNDIRQIFEIKINLECMLTSKAARLISTEEKDRLSQSVQLMKKASLTNDYQTWLKGDVEFHQILYSCSDNPRAHRIIISLNDQWNRVWAGLFALEGRMEKSVAEHQAICAAVNSGDEFAAEYLMREHLKILEMEVEQILQDLILPFTNKV